MFDLSTILWELAEELDQEIKIWNTIYQYIIKTSGLLNWKNLKNFEFPFLQSTLNCFP
jgi:hypothetical protein